jgi:hypothetical protein
MANALHTPEAVTGSTQIDPAFDEVLQLVGRLNYAWTNTESLLIHFIAGLAPTGKEAAIVIFLTLNTTRARLDLVERLAKMNGIAPDCRDAVLAATTALSRESRLRNKYNHCIYAFDSDGSNASTILMRINDEKKNISFGKVERIDARERSKIAASINQIDMINKRMWQVILGFGFPV